MKTNLSAQVKKANVPATLIDLTATSPTCSPSQTEVSNEGSKMNRVARSIKSRITSRVQAKVEDLKGPSANATAAPVPRNKKRFKGHGWSKKGSKKTRRENRIKPLAAQQSFHAVATGWRPGIYRERTIAIKQIERYPYEPKMGSFTTTTMEEAIQYMTVPCSQRGHCSSAT